MSNNLIAVVISDTHSKEKNIEWFKDPKNLKKVNCVIHAGDFSHSRGTFDRFLRWFSELDIKYKILIAGNHDFITYDMGYAEMFQICHTQGIIYLQDTSIELEGVKIHGSPWSTMFGGWPFMMNDFELDQHWQKIPDDTNVLIVHGPAYGFGDEVYQDGIQDNHVGSRTLEKRTRELKELKFLFTGHIHDSFGEINNTDQFIAYNACIMNMYMQAEGIPHTFQLN